MRVLVCGDRNWTDKLEIYNTLQEFDKDTVIIHGDCRGADRMAGAAAISLGMTVRVFPANWKKYGRRAGPIRNTQMLNEGNPDVVLAFHKNLDSSRGTKDMVRQAGLRDLIVILID